MIEVSSRIKRAFQSDSMPKRYYIYFPNIDVSKSGMELVANHDIVDDSFKLTENLNTEEQLHYGRCEGNLVEFGIQYTPYSLVGQIIDIYMILGDYETEPFTIGRYIISKEKIENNRLTKTITAYDILSVLNDIDVSYWCYNLQFPMTIKQLRTSLMEYVGQNQEDVTLINDTVVLNSNPWQGEMDVSFNKVISPICEWNAVFGGISRTGLFKYYALTPADNEETYPSSATYPSATTFPKSIRGKNYYVDPHLIKDDITWENYVCKPIDIIQVRNKDNNPVLEYTIPNTTDLNIYVISDNFIVDVIDDASLRLSIQRFAQAVYKVYYVPVDATMKMDLSLEVGDPITLTSTDGTRLPTYILKRTAEANIVAFDEVEATGKEEFEFDVANNGSTDSSAYEDLSERVDELGDRVTDMETDGSLQIISVRQLPSSPKKNVLYLIQGNVWVN